MTSQPEQLSDLQTWMQLALMDPVTGNDKARIAHYIAPAHQLTAAQSLAIYQRAYYNRLLECLSKQFKALHHTLGNELFAEFGVLYLEKFPSQSASLSNLGDGFPQFLHENRPDKDMPEPWVDFMIAMAEFECDLYRLFDQPGSEGELFADGQTPDAALQLQACFVLRQYPFDVNRYYQEVAAGRNPEIKPRQKIYVAFMRNNFQVFIIPLNAVQYELLSLMKDGKTVKDALTALLQKNRLSREQMVKNWEAWKTAWISKGFFLIKPDQAITEIYQSSNKFKD